MLRAYWIGDIDVRDEEFYTAIGTTGFLVDNSVHLVYGRRYEFFCLSYDVTFWRLSPDGQFTEMS